jgi:MoaA/NifB/PqqE/SkfB family radical SAM enzyme
MNRADTLIDFSSSLHVIWEVTKACDLAYVHCRASTQPNRNPLELSTEEGKRLIDDCPNASAGIRVD